MDNWRKIVRRRPLCLINSSAELGELTSFDKSQQVHRLNKLPMYGYTLILASLFCFAMPIGLHREEVAKKTWPSASGLIVEAPKFIRTTRAYLETPTTGRTARDDTYYRDVKVWALTTEYRYQVAGQNYIGTQATSTNHVDKISDYPDGPSQQMVEWSSQLSKGASVTIHYDPLTPYESYAIYTENSIQNVLVIGCVLMILGIILVAAPRFSR